MKTVYIVTSTDLGWDCIVGVYDNEDAAILFLEAMDNSSYILHKKTIQSEYDDE